MESIQAAEVASQGTTTKEGLFVVSYLLRIN